MLSFIFILFNGTQPETGKVTHPIILNITPMQCEMRPTWLENYFKAAHITNCIEYTAPQTKKPTAVPVPWK